MGGDLCVDMGIDSCADNIVCYSRCQAQPGHNTDCSGTWFIVAGCDRPALRIHNCVFMQVITRLFSNISFHRRSNRDINIPLLHILAYAEPSRHTHTTNTQGSIQ